MQILRWKQKYDQIPEDTKDPGLMKAKKALKKKQPIRRTTEQYWNEQQFQKLITAPPTQLASRGPLPWLNLFWAAGVAIALITATLGRSQRFPGT